LFLKTLTETKVSGLFFLYIVFNIYLVAEDDNIVLQGPRHSRSSSVTSGFYTGPPTTDDDRMKDWRVNEEEDEEEIEEPQPTKVMCIYGDENEY
jgi:hypothetical protein